MNDLQIFPANYTYFFSALGVQVHPLQHLATPVILAGPRRLKLGDVVRRIRCGGVSDDGLLEK